MCLKRFTNIKVTFFFFVNNHGPFKNQRSTYKFRPSLQKLLTSFFFSHSRVCTNSIHPIGRRSGPKFAALGPSVSEKQTAPPLRYFMYAPKLDNQITSIRSSAGST